ncbi:MAG: hypothetical protein GTO46_14345 [Gemmatimonadetes bacterium]|nr:hypothetical protein [Gemmatimonadota bacterium]NIO32767.1 hypothetical protein [Gemmatimonadota bacterium]
MIAQRMALLLTILTLAAPTTLIAQQEPPVQAGDRVRVTAPTIDPDMLVGTLVSLRADTCVLKVDDLWLPLALPRTSVTKLEVQRGRKSKAGLGAGVGFVTGAVIGGLLGSYWGQESCGWMEIPCIKKPAATVLGALGFGLAGAGIGALVGSRIRVDRWEEVPLDQLRITLLPQRRGLSVGLRVKL